MLIHYNDPDRLLLSLTWDVLFINDVAASDDVELLNLYSVIISSNTAKLTKDALISAMLNRGAGGFVSR
jgi:hypothetical protein